MCAFFVAAAARPSARGNLSVHPTDALGARRYEEGDAKLRRGVCAPSS